MKTHLGIDTKVIKFHKTKFQKLLSKRNEFINTNISDGNEQKGQIKVDNMTMTGSNSIYNNSNSIFKIQIINDIYKLMGKLAVFNESANIINQSKSKLKSLFFEKNLNTNQSYLSIYKDLLYKYNKLNLEKKINKTNQLQIFPKYNNKTNNSNLIQINNLDICSLTKQKDTIIKVTS